MWKWEWKWESRDNRMHDKNVLNVPQLESVEYDHNLIDIAVCELRFPTLLKLESDPPVKLQTNLRKKYPHYEVGNKVDLINKNAPQTRYYQFVSKSQSWKISLTSSSISLETVAYKNFADFNQRLTELLNEIRTFIDSDFFTRIGLRYVNSVPVNNGNLGDWVNPELVSIVEGGSLGKLNKFGSEIRGNTNSGNYTFRHGIKSIGEISIKEYLLDFDYYRENVEYNEVNSLIDQFNKINFSFFHWCLGPKTIGKLGMGIPK